MTGVMIKDLESERRVLAVDLRHVLSALGARALASEWRVREVWAEGDAKHELEAFDGSELISGQRLAAIRISWTLKTVGVKTSSFLEGPPLC